MKKQVIYVIRWIVGIAMILLTIGAFVSEDYLAGSIVLLSGLFLIPDFVPLLNKIITRQLSFKLPKLKLPLMAERFVRDLDLVNDLNLIETIDNRLKHSNKIIDKGAMKSTGHLIYRQIAGNGINSAFSKGEMEKLKSISTYFHLTYQQESAIKRSLTEKALAKIENLQSESFDQNYPQDYVSARIENLKVAFSISKETVEEIRKKTGQKKLTEFLEKESNWRIISPEGETAIFNEIKRLGYSPALLPQLTTQKTMTQLKRAKMLWRFENGVFSAIDGTDLNLNPSETCYLNYGGERLELETVMQGYSLNGGGLSFPVTKHISVGGGYANAKPVSKDVLNRFKGTLYLTSQRVVFLSSLNTKSFQIYFKDLLSFNLHSDGLEFIVDQNFFTVQLETNSVELYAAALTSAIRNSFDENNNMLSMAKSEMEKGEDFI
ncbi:MAG: hypothetical protein J0H55_01820 [Chitinophagaceae bacterium]|nr:hypothetical protein [Chitinophagaceae bacterium]